MRKRMLVTVVVAAGLSLPAIAGWWWWGDVRVANHLQDAAQLGAVFGEWLQSSPREVISPAGELRTVASVDLERYMGSWFEIARYPNRYQEGLIEVVATYALKPDGRIAVTNTGQLVGRRGKREKVSRAEGWVVDGGVNARWHVQFVWPWKADYWIIDLCPDYSYAVVGQPCRSNLWVLARQPQLPEATYAAICERLRAQGYDPSRLVRTPQSASR